MSSLNIGQSVRDLRLRRFGAHVFTMLLSTCFVAVGCKSSQTVWSATVTSPDGKLVATGRTSANSGFGIDGIPATFVYLSWATGSQQPMQIMQFANESGAPSTDKVEIKWISPKHLEVVYNKAGQDVEFQAVRFDDVCISLRDVSVVLSGAPSETCPK